MAVQIRLYDRNLAHDSMVIVGVTGSEQQRRLDFAVELTRRVYVNVHRLS